jgi:hypothetical protein
MALIDFTRTELDNTVRLFDKFYDSKLTVGANEYDVIFSYFVSVCKTTNAAANFTYILFRIAALTNEPVVTLLGYLQGKTGVEVNSIMAYYLNTIQSKTTLYGISNVPLPNPSVQRNVII